MVPTLFCPLESEKMQSNSPVHNSRGAGSSEPESFETTARRLLDSALALYESNMSLATEEVRECVRKLVAFAKSEGLAAERMLIELKRAWNAVAESAAHHKPEVISHLVTMCISEFYGGEAESREG